MGLFDNNKELNAKIKELGKLQQKLFASHTQNASAISQLKTDLIESTKRSPEYEKIAQQSSRKVSEFRNRAGETLEDVKGIYNESVELQKHVITIKNEIESIKFEIDSSFEEFKNENEELTETISILKERIDNIIDKISQFEETITKHPELDNEIIELETSINKIKENESKSSQLIKSITSRKVELETLYNEILGYEEEDETTNEIVKVNGLKQDLEESLNGLEEQTKIFKKTFEILENSTNEELNNLLKTNNEKILTQLEEWENKYTKLNKKIEGLLPNAVSAGLSHAFSEKKSAEDISYEKHKTQFSYGIGGMIAVSLIPFIISVITLLSDDSLDIVINRIPKIVIAILPLYIPVLWLSISSSKKMKLSKRLIEEYSHKEVLSKTYEGLSKQIHNLEEDNISKELKIKLLQDFLQMYSENPGKLISDYNSSDHPIMELLENSNKLEKTISKLEKIPGLHKLTDILEKKSVKKLEQATNIIEKNLDRIVGLNGIDKAEETETE